ncbi:efflux RND transporter periplasmic adaptor subunit [Comamonadaceae bacterium G21597-S1]|nr:efflux RND transporter periplasmic adaptor subunit [Comamonadaceae bacterium G21597-S1]
MRKIPLTGPAFLLAPLLAVVLTACSKPEPQPEPVRSVKLMTVQPGTMASETQYAGEVRARTELRLGFRVPGKLVRRQAQVGQRVKAGDVLAQLDPQDFKLAIDAVRAQLAAAETNRDLAAAEFQRYKVLRAQNFISGAELERRQATLDAANAQVAQARAQLDTQANQSNYTRLLATVPGVVTAVDAEPGQVVAVGTPVVRLAQDGPLDVVFAVPESSVDALPVGSRAEVRPWGGDTVRTGVVREKGALADPVTRTFQVKLALEPDARLPLGSTVTVSPQALSPKGSQAIMLPTSALWHDNGGSAVWVLESGNMTLRAQPVQIVAADGNQVVVASGLEPGMQVVVAGVHVLTAGQKVTVYRPKGTGTAPAAVSTSK